MFCNIDNFKTKSAYTYKGVCIESMKHFLSKE